ncbi:MAG: hypothetical protein BWZ10_00097 [candidate division BRC1 bacterium ADurb.BinA364]|nr:MAG: hypothetical protein BWZ10_00097 [candidate division BRC1 bacterium ADurb.BinA364]
MGWTKGLAMSSMAALALSGAVLMAQDPGQGGRGDRGPRGGEQGGDRGQRPGGFEQGRFGGFDREAMEQRISEALKQRLECSDEDWGVIYPMIQGVQEKQRAAGGGRGMAAIGMIMGGMRGPGGFGDFGRGGDQGAGDRRPEAGAPGDRGPGDRLLQDADPETRALSEAIQGNASAEDIKAKLDAYRAALAKREGELKAAREELRQVLTVKQEATLVLMGVLD